RSSPAGTCARRPATPPTVRTNPMLAGSHPRSARWIATNGPKPDCSAARKKFGQSSARRLSTGGRATGAVRTFATPSSFDERFERKVQCAVLDARPAGTLVLPRTPSLGLVVFAFTTRNNRPQRAVGAPEAWR